MLFTLTVNKCFNLIVKYRVYSIEYIVKKKRIAKSAKRKAIAQNLKFKYIILSIEFNLFYLEYYIAK